MVVVRTRILTVRAGGTGVVLIFRRGGGGGGGGGGGRGGLGENSVLLWRAVSCACSFSANLFEHRRPLLSLCNIVRYMKS